MRGGPGVPNFEVLRSLNLVSVIAIEAHQRAKDEKYGVDKAAKVADQVKKGVGLSRLRDFASVHHEVNLNCGVVETAADLLSDAVVLFDRGSCEKVDRLWLFLQETDLMVG